MRDQPDEPAPQVSAASRVAASIRKQIVEGALLPGERLPEERVRGELGVSRSTLREGFHALIQERLLVHILSRGFFVRRLSRADIADLFAVRRVLECGALRAVSSFTPQQLQRLSDAVQKGAQALRAEHWPDAAAANIGFHEALVELAGSDRLSTLMAQTLTEFRLSYAHMDDPLDFHVEFVSRHGALADLVSRGDLAAAEQSLHDYLHDSETALLLRVPEQLTGSG